MRNVSSAFKEALENDQREYIEYADFTLENGTTLNLTNEHFWQNGFSYEDSVSPNNKFQVGSAVINKVNLTINNIYGDFDEYDFFRAVAIIGVGLEINGVVERVNFGEFTVVDQPDYNGSLISIELYDNMFKFDEPYSESNLAYPASLDTIVRDACTNCGVVLGTTDFPNKNFVVQTRPDDEKLTFREVIAYAAQIAGCYARIEYSTEGHDGRLALRWFGKLPHNPPVRIPNSLFNTTVGMTAIFEDTRKDDVTTTVTGVNWFSFDGKIADNIYVHSNSWVVFGGSRPSWQGTSFIGGGINIYCRDGQEVSLYRQEGQINGIKFLKLRFEGYTRYEAQYQTEAYRLVYELFLVSNGDMILNIIQRPTASAYLGTSNIVMVSQGDYVKYLTLDVGVHRLYQEGYSWEQEGYGTNAIIIDSIYTHRVSTDNVVITGIKVSMDVEHEILVTEGGTSHTETVYEKAEYLEGTDGYVIAIENNPLIAESQIQTVAEYLGGRIIGFAFRTASATHGSDPSIEAGDVGYLINGKGQTYPIVISKTKFSVGSAQNTESVAEEPIRNSAARFSVEAQNYVKARKRIAAEKTQRQLIEDEINARIDNAGGLYETEVQQQGGGVITYLHNLPVLAESDIQIMVSSVGVMVTANGTASQPTWYGLTVDGALLANILSVSGIHADWINTGQLVITKNGSEVLFADVDTGTVRIAGSAVSITAGDPISAKYGTSTTAASTATKVVTCSGFQLYTGAQIAVKFTYANTASTPKLNVNSTGAKTIRAKNATLAATYYWTANSLVQFTYDGTYWVMEVQDQTEVFNRLTNNGSAEGIFIQNGQLYINMSYLQTGILKVGGANNGNGVFEVYNSSGTRTGLWNNGALYIGNVSGTSSTPSSPNTKIDTAGAITTKSLTANDYIYVDGNENSFFKIPLSKWNYQTGVNTAFVKIDSEGFKAYSTYYNIYTSLLGTYTSGSTISRTSGIYCGDAEHYMNATKYIAIYKDFIRLSDESGTWCWLDIASKYIECTRNSNVILDFNMNSSPAQYKFVGTLIVSGTKSRKVNTKDYGNRLLYCYETPSPTFGDIGEGTISDDGKCYVQIDGVFAETVTLNQYQVFLQKYGDGDCWVSERKGSYFIVEGTPGLSFGWELKAKQSDFDQYRLETDDLINTNIQNSIDYANELNQHIRDIQHEREVA